MLRAAGRANGRRHPLEGKRVYVAPMADGSARAFAAVFRAHGIDAEVTPPSDQRTLEVGSRYTSGDECFPAKITAGDYLKVLERPGVDPARVALFMPTAGGPCRFGQYAPFLRHVLDEHGYRDTPVISTNADGSYGDLGVGPQFIRSGWRALVAGDILRKLLLIHRPYELEPGAADAAHEASLGDVCGAIERAPLVPAPQLAALHDAIVRSRDRFRRVPARRDRARPLIGIVGEIFCRLNTFSNDNLVRRLEAQGAEAWMSDVGEWIWYVNADHIRKLALRHRLLTVEYLVTRLRHHVQRRDEERLLEPVREDIRGLEEPQMREVLDGARPYLPNTGAYGEMVLNVGKVIQLAARGVDGVIDISPFTCMNGIVCEAIYPRLSRDLGGLPIRNFYFDGTQSDLDRDLGVFLELARAHQKRKPHQRVYPPYPA